MGSPNTHHEHHFRNLGRARDALTEVMASMDSALALMSHEDWLDGMELRDLIWNEVAPRLSALRDRSSARFDEWSRHPDFQRMRTGQIPFPDERVIESPPPAPPSKSTLAPPPSEFPNAKEGAALVAKHGSLDAALMAYPPATPEHDAVRAFEYVSTGRRPKGWIPPIVGGFGGAQDEEAA